jgi:hypothetical protein
MYLTELENIPEKIKTDVPPNRIYTYSSVDPLTATTTAQQLFITGTYRIAKNKNLFLSIYIPSATYANAWGGIFVSTNIKINTAWHNLGNSGYDGNTMVNNTQNRGTYYNTKVIDLIASSLVVADTDFDLQVQVKVKTYNNTVIINDLGMNINTLMSVDKGSILPWMNNQNFSTVHIEEMDR